MSEDDEEPRGQMLEDRCGRTSACMRDELAYRKLRGDELSAREQLLLLVLNRISQLVMRPQDPISEEVLEAAAEVRRLRAKHRR